MGYQVLCKKTNFKVYTIHALFRKKKFKNYSKVSI